jgi:hypothetical protein
LALTNNTVGYSNIAIGNTSMASNTTAYNNIAIGNSADSGNHNNTIVIGNNISASADNSIIIGNDSQTTYINGTLSTPAIILNGTSLEDTLATLAGSMVNTPISLSITGEFFSLSLPYLPKYDSVSAAYNAGLALWSVFRIDTTLTIQNIAKMYAYSFYSGNSLQMSNPSTAIKNLKNSNTWTVEGWFYGSGGIFPVVLNLMSLILELLMELKGLV